MSSKATTHANDASSIKETYRRRTPKSQEFMLRAVESMPDGTTRSLGFWKPYPLVIDHGEGPHLWDVDGNRYVDLVYNGASLIHGHAYPPVNEAVRTALKRGSAWPSPSVEQIEFAEVLCSRIAAVERVRFTNTGTEAGMLAVKIARKVTGRSLILKAWAGYHGSYDDLEAGLYGQGEVPGRVLLGEFGDVGSFERVLSERGDQVAAVVMEPIMYTGVVTPPPPGFLRNVQEAARRAGALFVLDDCIMFRLAEGGSAEKYGLEPDIIFLGKFIGGGLPVGAVGGSEEVMSVLDANNEMHMYHGGSFNGNLLGCVAGTVAVRELSGQRIQKMDEQAARLRTALERKAASLGVPLSVSGDGSAFGVYLTDELPGPTDRRTDKTLGAMFHLAALNHGVYMGNGGEAVMATVMADEVVHETVEALGAALEDMRGAIPD